MEIMILCAKSTYENRLKELGLFDTKAAQGDLITLFQYLRSNYREGGDSIFTRVHGDKSRGSRHKLLQGKFFMNIRKKISLLFEQLRHWIKSPREVVKFLSLPGGSLVTTLDNLMPCFQTNVGPDDLHRSLPTYAFL